MTNLNRLVGARVLFVLALVSALAIPWAGWAAFAVLVMLVLIGTLVAPPPASHAHRGRLRVLFEAVRRRLVHHPWRPRRL